MLATKACNYLSIRKIKFLEFEDKGAEDNWKRVYRKK